MAAKPGLPTCHATALSLNCKDENFGWLVFLIILIHAVIMLRLVDIAFQVVCVLMVCFHVLELLFDESAMPRGIEVRFISMTHIHIIYTYLCVHTYT